MNNNIIAISGTSNEDKFKSNLESPNFTGEPTVPDVDSNDSSSKIANTKFVKNSINSSINSEIADRNSAITYAINNEVTERNAAISDAINLERSEIDAALSNEISDRMLDESLKANLSGANFTGNITVPKLSSYNNIPSSGDWGSFVTNHYNPGSYISPDGAASIILISQIDSVSGLEGKKGVEGVLYLNRGSNGAYNTSTMINITFTKSYNGIVASSSSLGTNVGYRLGTSSSNGKLFLSIYVNPTASYGVSFSGIYFGNLEMTVVSPSTTTFTELTTIAPKFDSINLGRSNDPTSPAVGTMWIRSDL